MKTILLTEDDRLTRLIYRQCLERAGYRVVEAADAAGAVHAFKTMAPAGILLDVLLNGSTGLDALRVIRSLPGGDNVPVIVLTNAFVPAILDQARQLGALCFSKDQFTPEQICRMFNNLPKPALAVRE